MHPLLRLGLVLLLLWAILWLGFAIPSGLVHLLVLAAVVLIVLGIVKQAARTVRRRS